MYSSLSWWPLALFGIIEPVLLSVFPSSVREASTHQFSRVYAGLLAMKDPFNYLLGQAPNYPISVHEFNPQSYGVVLQLGNVFFLLAAMAIICSWTDKREVTFWYLVAVGFADFGHVYATAAAVGSEYFWNPAGWNDMVAGNVIASVFLNINRWLTVLGVFGSMQALKDEKRKRT